MDNEERKEFIDQIQKDITSKCFKICYNLMDLKIDSSCFNVCYNKYLETLKIVYQEIRDIGYESHSTIAYKMFPEENPFHEAYYGNYFLSQKSPVQFSYDYVTNKMG